MVNKKKMGKKSLEKQKNWKKAFFINPVNPCILKHSKRRTKRPHQAFPRKRAPRPLKPAMQCRKAHPSADPSPAQSRSLGAHSASSPFSLPLSPPSICLCISRTDLLPALGCRCCRRRRKAEDHRLQRARGASCSAQRVRYFLPNTRWEFSRPRPAATCRW